MRKRLLQSTYLKRILSFILCLGMMVGYLPQGVMTGTDLARITIEFADAIEMESTASPILHYFDQRDQEITAKGAEISYDIQPDGILTEAGGVFTPVKMGSATVTVTVTASGVTKNASTQVAVVGKNLIYNKNAPTVDEGSFEGLLYTSDIKEGAAFSQRYWLVYSAVNNAATYSAVASYDASPENVRHGEQSLKVVCDSEANGATQRFKAELCRNLIAITPGHLYELTGYVKAQDIKTDSGVSVGTMYANKDSKTSAAFANTSMNRSLYLSKTPYNRPDKYPFEQVIKDDGTWQKFTVPASLPTVDTLTYCKLVLMNTNTTANGTYWFDELRYREVVFNRLDFTTADDISALKAGDTLTTAVKFYSNTGNELTYSAGSVLPTVIYATTNDKVATVDTDGKITVVGAGRAEITAETTIAGVTCKGKITLTVAQDASELDAAKTNAKKELADEFAKYSEANYTPENWLLLVGAKDNGIAEIEAAATTAGVAAALTAAKNAMADVEKKPAAATLKSVSLSFGKNEFVIGETAAAELSGTMTDDTNAVLTGATITYESTDSNVLEVAVDGTITAKNAGDAAISVSVTLNGVTKTANVPITVTAPKLARVELTVPGQIALYTTAKSSIKLFDEQNHELSAEGATIAYKVSDSSYFEISDTGVITAKKLGDATLTATVTLAGTQKSSDPVTVTIATRGENRIVDANADFEQDMTFNGTAASTGRPWLNTNIADRYTKYEVKPILRNGNADNKALAITIQEGKTGNPDALRLTYDKRAVLEEGKFYELSFWIKSDLNVPEGSAQPLFYADMYTYHEKGETAGATTGTNFRKFEVQTVAGYPFDGEWTLITVPVTAPLQNTVKPGEPIYATPRIHMRPGKSSGVTGTMWIDDVQIREVGFDHVDASVSGDIENGKANLVIKPYATSGTMIAMLYNEIPNYVSVESDQTAIIETGAVVSTSPSKNTVAWATAPLTNVGKGGTANIKATVELCGVKRDVTVPITVASKIPTLKSVALSFDKSEYALGDTATANVLAMMTDDKAADLTKASVTYRSSNTNVLDISNTGVITPKNEGDTTVTVTVTIDGVTKEVSAPLTVFDASALKTVTLKAPEKLFFGDEVTLSVSGTMASGNAAYLPNATIVYSIVEQSEDGVISLDASSGKIRGLKIDATAKVKATMTIRGTAVDSNIVTIKVLERKPLTVTLGIAGQESNIVPIGAAQTMQIGLRDINGDAVDPASASIQYAVSPADAAAILDGGVIDIKKLGDITVTATVTVGEHTASASYTLHAQTAGENLFADLNPDFNTDEWVWQNAFSNEPNGQLVRGTIGTAPRDGDASNRALGLRLDPAVTATSANADILRLKFAKRPQVQAGKLYELSFWVKVDTDYYDEFNQFIDTHEYKNRTGESSSDVTGSYIRNLDLKTYVTGKADGWVHVTLPVPAPLVTDNADGTAYLSPRFSMFRPLASVIGKSGLDGVIWFDDFELCEVGLGEIKTELTGDTSAVENVAKLTIMPYTTNGTQIAVAYNKAGEVCTVTSSDPDVASVSAVRATSNKNEVAWECADVKIVGKNGTAQLTATVNLAGVSRTAVTSLTTSDLPTVLRELKIQVEKPEMQVDTTQKITLAAILTDGTTATDLSGAKTAIYSSEADIIDVDQDGNLTALREGESVIRADINMNGIIRSAEVKVKVIDESGIASATLSVPETIMEGRPTMMCVSGLMESGKELYVENAEITYVIEEMSEEGCVEVSDTGMITGKKAGTTARIRVDISLRGKTVSSAPVTVTVVQSEPTDLVIDFKGRAQGVNVVGNVSFEQDGWEANTGKTSQFCLNTAKCFRFLNYGIQAQVQKVETPVEADTAYDIRIPYTGDYTFSFSGADFAAGAGVAAIFVDGEYVGEYNFYDAANDFNTWGPVTDMKSLHLDSGIHTVIIRSLVAGNNGKGSANQYPSCITFKGIEKLPELEGLQVVFGQGALSIGDTTSVSASLCYDDGSAVKAYPGLEADGSIDTSKKPIYENLTPDILSLDANGNVTALKEGVGKIRATAYINGVQEIVEGEITVLTRVLDSVTITVEKTQLFIGDTCAVSTDAFFNDGGKADDIKPAISSDNTSVISVSGNTLTAKSIGTANITATAEYDGVVKTASIAIRVAADGLATIELTADPTTMKPSDDGVQISVKALSNKNIEMPLNNAVITYQAEDNSVVHVSETGFVAPKAIGSTKVNVTVKIGENTASAYLYFSITEGKTQSSIYTPEMVSHARDNVNKYNWAWDMKESSVKAAEQYVKLSDKLWNMVPGEGIPRSTACGFVDEPYAFTCRYCGCDLRAKYGMYSWILDPLSDPWKVRCPDCRRSFPSNDFAGFYQLGLNEHGVFNRELAKQRNDELVASGEDGYLKNILYPEKDAELGVANWGVDDGFGYVTGKTHTLSNGKTIEERHTYIAYYMEYGLWCTGSSSKNGGLLVRALQNLRDAYLYTGDERYGRTGAILIDRIADVYPDYDLRPYYMDYKGFQNSHGGSGQGKILGRIWEAQQTAPDLARAYDAFYPMMDDPQVVSFLNEKAVQYNLENDKSTPEKIRENGENGILREIYKGCKNVSISGNFGMMQTALGLAAVALDTMPETAEWIDFVMQPGTTNYSSDICTGGNVLPALINQIGRDGIGDENAPGYNYIWLSSLIDIADTFSNYKKYDGANLWENPKMQAMLPSWLPLILCGRYQAQIGDSGSTGNLGTHLKLDDTLVGYINTKNPVLAQATYWLNNNSVTNLHTDIFTKDPEKIQRDIQNVIDQYGEYNFSQSTMQPSWGLAVLRDGSYNPASNVSETYDTQRDFWMYFGRTSGHGHTGSMLNLGIHAYGLDMAPDLGYPEATGRDPNRMQWINTSLSHTAVSVNDKNQGTCTSNGIPLHFDDTGRVKVMDVDTPQVFANTDIYRRTVVMVKADDEVSYGFDFFRIQGGDDHLYSFHAASHESTTENVTLVEQVGGSYAGINVPWGENAKYMNGYTWLDDVRSARNLKSGNFAVDFKIGDFRNILPRSVDLHLRMTMLNDFNLSEMSLAKGTPPRTSENRVMGKLEYVLARRSAKPGESLDTLFTTVFEPYESERYIESIERVSVAREDGATISENEKVSAVRVRFKNGRIDTVIYAHDNTVSYLIDGRIPFRGFIGVVTEIDGTQVYSYLNDGDKLADASTELAAYTGTVTDFTKELTTDNSIVMTLDQVPDVDVLAGHYIQIRNDGAENAYYQIESATLLGGNTVKLNVGNNTLIRSLVDNMDMSKGYVYNIAEGQRGRIALSYVDDTSPIIVPIHEKQVEAGSELKFQVVAESPLGKTLSYSAKRLPRGAQFDAAPATFAWIPDSSQVGNHSVTLEVSDGLFASSVTVPITVYYSTNHGGDKPIDPNPPVITVEEDEVKFAASTEETTADTKLGSVIFPNGTFAEDGQGTLKIKKENEKFNISVSATVDMEEKPAKVSLNYTPADNMADKNCIVVKDANGNIIPNGKYADGKMTFYTDAFGDFTIVYNPKSFTDLGNHAWADDAITRLAARGIINGITRTTYGPARNITRADFTTLIVRAFGFEGEAANFADVPANAYYAEPVGIAKTLGIVGGVNESDFAPTAEITRQDMMVIVARALDQAGYVLDASESPEFSDTAEVADYAKDAVQTLTASGIITGAGGKINPKGKTTRAEVAVILDRILFMRSPANKSQ